MSTYFKAEHIKKSFETRDGVKEVLKDISIEVKEQEFVCIMGTSGCGKSTLMRILEGIESPDDGKRYFSGQEISKKTDKKIQSKFGIVYQNDNLLDWSTVYKNVEMPLSIFGIKETNEVKEHLMNCLDLVGLVDFKDCYPHELSGGMKQRAAIARALVNDPDILMLDQPFGALDAITRRMLNVSLLKIWNETKKACIMITNNVNEALYLGQRVLIMSNSPSTIIKEINVPFSYEERNDDEFTANKEYLRLRTELNETVRGLNRK